MSTIRVNTIQHSSANSGNMILHANGNVSMLTANSTLFIGNTSISNAGISISGSTVSPFGGMRNRIINGAMMIDQRYAGVANTVASSVSNYYVIDRFFHGNIGTTGTYTVQQMNGANTSASNYESGSVPSSGGFINSMKLTVGTANTATPSAGFTGVYQTIEGLNTYDLSWGTAAAKSITVSFWVKSSITGQFSSAVWNTSGTQTYPMSFTINQANTWQFVTLVIPGSTTGTWLTNNNAGIYFAIFPSLGSAYLSSSTGWTSNLYGLTGQTNWMATSGNTFYITGLQIEAGTVATPFEFRQYGTELALCQRYYFQFGGSNVYDTPGMVTFWSTTYAYSGGSLTYPVPMRATPTMTTSSGSHWYVNSQGYSPVCTAVNAYSATPTNTGFQCIFASGGGVGGYCGFLQANNTLSARLYFSADI
jgi:hypothetical protein